MSSAKSSVLVTGANGFVGSRLCRFLLEKNLRVVAGVRRRADLSLLADLDVEYRYGDVTDADTLSAMVADVDFVVHNAGIVKAKRREDFFRVNEQGTRNLFDAMVATNPELKRIVYVSSLAAVGPSRPGQPLTEKDEPHPITTYGESKLAGERAALSYADRCEVVAVRPPGVYGPGDREMFTLFQTVNRHLRPHVGEMSRLVQVVHVDDLCRGIYLAMTKPVASGSAYFIAERRSYGIRDFLAILVKSSGKSTMTLRLPSPLFFTMAAISEFCFRIVGATPMLTREKVRELNASWEVDPTAARDDLGYESEIDWGVGTWATFAWYRERGWLS